jgi:hypothetical protein
MGFFIFFADSGAIQPVFSWAKIKVAPITRLNPKAQQKIRRFTIATSNGLSLRTLRFLSF